MRQTNRGDTIIEVMFSFTVLSLLVVSTYMVMNRGTQIAQRSLEITLVRQQIDSQVSMIRYAQANNTPLWQKIRSDYILGNSGAIVDPSSFASSNQRCPTVSQNDLTSGRKAFYVTQNSSGDDIVLHDVTESGAYGEPTVYANVDYSHPVSYGIFIQVVSAESNRATGTSSGGTQAGRAYDVYINACWDSVGTSVPSTIGTITRIYDGNN